ncbi:MAG: sporulation protein YunB [Ruminococcus sp.]|nr:sporulation protein YunB [Ruminococcus sp.]
MTALKPIRLRRACLTVFIIAAAAACAFAVIYFQLVKHMKEICEYKGRQSASNIICEAIAVQLENESENYLDIVYDDEGNIVSIKTDSTKINTLENELVMYINEELAHIEDNEMGIPIGTLSGITILSGRGPKINVKLHQVGAVDVKVTSEFSSAGINQTKHTLKVDVTIELSAILPAHSTDITATDEYLISETIIVGKIPEGIIYTES